MSYTFDTSDQGRNLSRNKRTTISNILASTPVNDAPARRYTTSLSRIDTNSSLSEGKTEGRLQSQIASKDLLCRHNYIFVNSSYYEQIHLFHHKKD